MTNNTTAVGSAVPFNDWIDPLEQALREGVQSYLRERLGQKILRAIVAGERDAQVLGSMKNSRIHASVDAIAKSLQGNWRAEHLFALKQALGAFDFIGTRLTECDREIEQPLQCLQAHEGEPAKGKQRGRARNAPKFDSSAPSCSRCVAWT